MRGRPGRGTSGARAPLQTILTARLKAVPLQDRLSARELREIQKISPQRHRGHGESKIFSYGFTRRFADIFSCDKRGEAKTYRCKDVHGRGTSGAKAPRQNNADGTAKAVPLQDRLVPERLVPESYEKYRRFHHRGTEGTEKAKSLATDLHGRSRMFLGDKRGEATNRCQERPGSRYSGAKAPLQNNPYGTAKAVPLQDRLVPERLVPESYEKYRRFHHRGTEGTETAKGWVMDSQGGKSKAKATTDLRGRPRIFCSFRAAD